MAEDIRKPVTMEELLISNLAQTDAIADLLIEKGLATRDDILKKISERRAVYQQMLNPIRQ